MAYTYNLSGRLDTTTAPEFQKNVTAAQEEHGELILDAKDLAYISSAGLRVLLSLRKKQGELSIINVSADVYDILDVTGFTDILDVKQA